MKIGPFELARRTQVVPAVATPVRNQTPTLSPVTDSRGGWWPTIREFFAGAWQQNVQVSAQDALAYFAVYACTTLIAADVAKCCCRLVEEVDDGVWEETDSPAFSPVLRKPNRFQTRLTFFQQWVVSKLTWGNTYVLKVRDKRQVVVAMYILDPSRVRPLVAPDGAVYYSLGGDNLAGVDFSGVIVPASEIIHDVQCPIYHPLVGVSPISACGVAAVQGLAIQASQSRFFASGSRPGGILTAPGPIDEVLANRIKADWDANFTGDNAGKVAVLGEGLKYEPMGMTAHDAQLIDQLRFSAETVCSCYHVLPYMIGLGQPPPYANVEPLLMAYYAQALQVQFTAIELVLEDGLGISEPIGGTQYGVEFDIDDLIWMDTATRIKAATDAVKGVSSADEARRKWLGWGPTKGGAAVLSQQQNYSLEALAKRDASADPFGKTPAPAPAGTSTPLGQPPEPNPNDPTPPQNRPDWVEILALVEAAFEEPAA